MKPGEAVQQTFMVVAVTCAVVITALRVRDALRPAPAAAQRGPASTDPVPVPDWQQYAAVGHRMGPANAPVTIIEFADFECPVCRKFELGALRYIRNRYPNDVQVVFRHWPLPYHRFAYPAARAAECAGAQGKFEAYHDLLYEKQDSLGLKSFDSFARDAGVADLTVFATCDTATLPVAVIARDSAAARRIGGRGPYAWETC
jgi:protein-disulfide isomerase